MERNPGSLMNDQEIFKMSFLSKLGLRNWFKKTKQPAATRTHLNKPLSIESLETRITPVTNPLTTPIPDSIYTEPGNGQGDVLHIVTSNRVDTLTISLTGTVLTVTNSAINPLTKLSFFNGTAFGQTVNTKTGVYTLDFIPNHSFIDYYIGDFCKYPLSKYFIEIDHNFGIDAGQFPRCYMAMINDSYQTTYTNACEFLIENKTVSVYSIRDIQPGEELFISYGDQSWN